MEFLNWLEQTAFCSWVRDSGSMWAYPLMLTLHTTGMGVLVGFNWAVDLRLLGVARQIPVRAMEKFFPVMWTGFWVNLITGLVLLAADATTKMTSWVFGVKILFIILAMIVLVRLQKTAFGSAGAIVANGIHQSTLAVPPAGTYGFASTDLRTVAVLELAPSVAIEMASMNTRVLASLSLLLWALSITAGRLMAYLGPVSGLK
jgi:hypothetical protein